MSKDVFVFVNVDDAVLIGNHDPIVPTCRYPADMTPNQWEWGYLQLKYVRLRFVAFYGVQFMTLLDHENPKGKLMARLTEE